VIGEPADNAAHFFEWLNSLRGDLPLSNIKYAVFGCGNRDWVQTYQRIPTLIDELITKNGGKALIPRGEGDARGSEMFTDFDNWEESLFKKLTEVKSCNSSPCRRIYPLPSRNIAPPLRQ
jgi:cytochrome P450/NADPH-cytochrome P450 reductase